MLSTRVATTGGVYVPRRTVAVNNFYAHKPRKPNDRFAVDNFDGKGADLLCLLRGFIAQLDEGLLVDDEHQRYISILDMQFAGRTLYVETEAGWYGDAGRVKHVRTHEVLYEHDEEASANRTLRFWCVAPRGAKGMLVFTERAANSSASSRILALFHAALRAGFADQKVVFKNDALVEQAAWLASANLERVNGYVNAYEYSADVADKGKTRVVGALSMELVPTGGRQFFPKSVWEGLKARDLNAARVLGLTEEWEVDRLTVTVENEGRHKTFAIDKEREPAITYLLSDKGTPQNEVFVEFCQKQAIDLLPSLDAEWEPSLSNGDWTAEELDMKVSTPSEQ